MAEHSTQLEQRLARGVLVIARAGGQVPGPGAEILVLETGARTGRHSREPGLETRTSRESRPAGQEAEPGGRLEARRNAGLIAGVLELPSPAMGFDQQVATSRAQAAAHMDRGADLLWLETAGDLPTLRAALSAIASLGEERGTEIPVWISAAIPHSSEPLSAARTGRPPDLRALWAAVRHAGPLGFGLHTEVLTDEILERLEHLSKHVSTHLSLSVASPETDFRPVLDAGINALGIGAGASRQQVAALLELAGKARPRPVPPARTACLLSGREMLALHPDGSFVKIGERANVAGSARFARLIREQRYEEALQVIRRQIAAGAQIIDLNVDGPGIDGPAEMTALLQRIAGDPEASRVPLMIDSADWGVLEAGARHLPGRGIVNSITLERGAEEFVRRARWIRRMGAVPALVAIDAQGPAIDRGRKVEICARGWRLATEEAGCAPYEVILDPAILAIGTGLPEQDDAACAYLAACRALRERLPGCLISGGVSNLSFAYRGSHAVRDAMHAVFLHHAIAAGMNMAIVNVARWQEYAALPEELRAAAEDVVLNRRPDAPIRLARLARRLRAEESATPPAPGGPGTESRGSSSPEPGPHPNRGTAEKGDPA